MIGPSLEQLRRCLCSSPLATAQVNVTLRAITLGSRFLLVFFIARYLTLQDLGIYGLMTATIGFALYVLGMDFYAFNIRDMLARDTMEWGRLLRDQFALHLIVYAIVLPMISGIFFLKVIHWRYALWLYFLLVLEHLCQEIGRVIEALGRSTLACVYQFIRSGAWVYVFIVLVLEFPQKAGLTTLFATWAIGGVLSLSFAMLFLRGLGWEKGWLEPIDWARIKKGIKVAIPFFLSTLSQRAVSLIDRYLIQYYWTSELVGIYSFYFNVANGVQDFVNAGVIIAIYPPMLSAYQKGRLSDYRKLYTTLGRRVTVATLSIGGVAAIGIFGLLPFLRKPEFVSYLSVYWMLLFANAINLLGVIPFYDLYARGADKRILYSALASLAVSIGAYMAFIPVYGIGGAALGFMIAGLSLGSTRFLLARSFSRNS